MGLYLALNLFQHNPIINCNYYNLILGDIMLTNNQEASESLSLENDSLEIVDFIKKMLNSIDMSNKSKILTSLNTLKTTINK